MKHMFPMKMWISTNFCSIKILFILPALVVSIDEYSDCNWPQCTGVGSLIPFSKYPDYGFHSVKQCGQPVQQGTMNQPCENERYKLYYHCNTCHRFHCTNHPGLYKNRHGPRCPHDHINKEHVTLNLLDKPSREGPSNLRR
ncbi:hypothetical protein PGTUg99_010060 [Puccinia graminis f. sp. tritici]|uniref:C2H2-type domain-containing protein n=1 Tax=Puccinia graminis f. sp. tritici TaxID=56615 RepID=A0A5B0M051_PUCGR|nr:hypothetical protein PGTUg99_010060 [Puccinia graminis f. sp. tritici]